jgi:hypothetical protein
VWVKWRAAIFGDRLRKEAHWLRAATAGGWPTPRLLQVLDEDAVLALVLAPVAWRPLAATPSDWRVCLAPWHDQHPPGAGWGPLRRDGRGRWREASGAVAWWDGLLRRVGADEGVPLLHDTWQQRPRRLVHGDLHRRNRRGPVVLDWETLGAGDPLDDAARLSLDSGFSSTAWAAAWGAVDDAARWRLARLLAAAEAAAYPGPLQGAGQRTLATILATLGSQTAG